MVDLPEGGYWTDWLDEADQSFDSRFDTAWASRRDVDLRAKQTYWPTIPPEFATWDEAVDDVFQPGVRAVAADAWSPASAVQSATQGLGFVSDLYGDRQSLYYAPTNQYLSYWVIRYRSSGIVAYRHQSTVSVARALASLSRLPDMYWFDPVAVPPDATAIQWEGDAPQDPWEVRSRTFWRRTTTVRVQATPSAIGGGGLPWEVLIGKAPADYYLDWSAPLASTVVYQFTGTESVDVTIPVDLTGYGPDDMPLVTCRLMDGPVPDVPLPGDPNLISGAPYYSRATLDKMVYVDAGVAAVYRRPRYRYYIDAPTEATGPANARPAIADFSPEFPGATPTIVVNNPSGNEVSRGRLPPGTPQNALITLRRQGDWLVVLYKGRIICTYRLTPDEYALAQSGGWWIGWLNPDGSRRGDVPPGCYLGSPPAEGFAYAISTQRMDSPLGSSPLLRRGLNSWGPDVLISAMGEVSLVSTPLDPDTTASGTRYYRGGNDWLVDFDTAVTMFNAGYGDQLRVDDGSPALTLPIPQG